MDLSGPHGYLHSADAFDNKPHDKGFLKGLLGAKESDVGKKLPIKPASPTSVPKKFMDMISPLLMGSSGSASPSPKGLPPQQPGSSSKDKMSTGSGTSSVDAHAMSRAMSHNSGLTEFVNKMKISEAGATPNGAGGKRSKLSNDSSVSTSSSMSIGSQMSMQSAGPAPPASMAPVASAPVTPSAPPAMHAHHHSSPLSAAHVPTGQLNSNSYTSNLDRLLEAARYCQLPQSGRPLQPMPADPMANPYPGPTILLTVSPQTPPRMQRQQWRLSDYALGDKLYTGYASTVYKAVCRASGEVVVLKIYHLLSVCDLYKYQIYREVRVHSSLAHENVVQLYAAFQEGDKVILVQEYADGSDLFTLLHKYGGRLSERLAVQLVLEPFLRVLQYLHSRAIIHRDIKPENILFNKAMCLKLGDFGLAIDLREERAVTRAGTLDYMAPEVLRCPFKSRPEENKDNERLHYSARVDAWAVGVLTYELLVGFPPFFDQSRTNTEDRIMSSLPVFPANMSEEARSFIAKALSKHAADRPTILEMLHHPWVEQYRTRRSMRSMTPAGAGPAQQQVPLSPVPVGLSPAAVAAAQQQASTPRRPAPANVPLLTITSPSSQPVTPIRPLPPSAASLAMPGAAVVATPTHSHPSSAAFASPTHHTLTHVLNHMSVSQDKPQGHRMPASPNTPLALQSPGSFMQHIGGGNSSTARFSNNSNTSSNSMLS